MSPDFIEEEEFESLLLSNLKLLDVRSEGEFESGAFPASFNIPILKNEERASVGTTYKQQGQENAIRLGQKLVSGAIKEERVTLWKNYLQNQPEPALYCARGGLRSQIAQQWLKESGTNVRRVRGGYKWLRRYLLKLNIELPAQFSFTLISGHTGSGKTLFLNQLSQSRKVIDLEGIARHRGSSFGDVYGGQPSQSDFENELARELLLQRRDGEDNVLFVEAESRRIGRSFIPIDFWRQMSEAPIYVLELSLEERVENIFTDYVEFVFEEQQRRLPDDPVSGFRAYLEKSLWSLQRYLGLERTKQLHREIQAALEEQIRTGDLSLHKLWIRRLLVEYYDPHYETHLARNSARIHRQGHPKELLQSLIRL